MFIGYIARLIFLGLLIVSLIHDVVLKKIITYKAPITNFNLSAYDDILVSKLNYVTHHIIDCELLNSLLHSDYYLG